MIRVDKISTEGYVKASIKNMKLGYDLLGEASLLFNIKDKSIKCSALGSIRAFIAE